MPRIVPPSEDFKVYTGVISLVEPTVSGGVAVSLTLENEAATTVTLEGVSPKMIKAFLGSTDKGTPALLLSTADREYSVGIGKPGSGTWLTRFGY